MLINALAKSKGDCYTTVSVQHGIIVLFHSIIVDGVFRWCLFSYPGVGFKGA